MEIHGETYPAAIIFEDYTLLKGTGMIFWSGEGFWGSFRGAIIDDQQDGIVTSKEAYDDN